MATGPGLLYVSAEPHSTLTPAQFHDWYNNEHGPVRLRLPFVVNGFRYRARGDAKPSWLALYDITDVAELTRKPYTSLREPANKTRRETDTMRQITLDRRIYDLLYTKAAAGHEPRPDQSAQTLVIATVTIPKENEATLQQWTLDEYIPAIAKTPGWRRSRRFRTSPIDNQAVEYMVIHDFASSNEVNGPAFRAALETTAAAEIRSKATSMHGPFIWDLQYTFGPAPRELGTLWDPTTAAFSSLDGKTRTVPVPAQPAIESFVTTEDGVDLPYRLEGNGDDNAPLVVLVNSILVDWSIWDGFVSSFVADPRHKHFRVLRYNARGRSSQAGTQDATLDLLTHDLLTLLDAVRVHRHVAAVGVSLGGATVLNTALQHPDRLPRFVACDTNDVAPKTNPEAWKERIAMAEAEGASSEHGGGRIVGDELAAKTVQRWMSASSWDGGAREAAARRVTQVVRANSLDGFKAVAPALYAYDLQPRMKDAIADGLFVVGEHDGVLPRTMAAMAERYGAKGTELAVIGHAGHLPMVEQPAKMAEVVGAFLCRT